MKKQFTDYVWSFYGPQQIYGDFFDHSLTKEELTKAINIRMKSKQFEGDTFDREAVRDLMLKARGKPIQGLG